jgi:hypothetical protein
VLSEKKILSETRHHNPPLQVKWSIVYNDNKSDFFSSEVGFRQSENVYTFLFAVFLNDLEQFMEDNNIRSTIEYIFIFSFFFIISKKALILYIQSKVE